MARINGRTIRPSTLAERRLLLSLGTPSIRVPRSANPFIVARRLSRAARGDSPDVMFVRDVLSRHKPMPPRPKPDVDVPHPPPGPIEAQDVAPA